MFQIHATALLPGSEPSLLTQERSRHMRQRVGMLQNAFRADFAIEDMITEGDKVVVRWTNHVVHHGTFFGIPATGKSATVHGIDIIRLRDGKMPEHWDAVDTLSLLQQLGAFPPPSATGA